MEWLTNLVPFGLLALVCPLVMLLMMRGMHGGHRPAGETGHTPDTAEDGRELADLRAGVAALRAQVGATPPPSPRARRQQQGASE